VRLKTAWKGLNPEDFESCIKRGFEGGSGLYNHISIVDMYKYLNLFAIELLNYRVCLVSLISDYMIEYVRVSPFPS
jgi:hypothetical protein